MLALSNRRRDPMMNRTSCILALSLLVACSGSDGKNGVDGADGEQGPPGEQGPAGEDGDQGPAGEDGDQGPAGEDGEQGPAGEDGEQGPAGEDGEQGPAGEDGEQGSPGTDGVNGVNGVDGLDGEDGASVLAGSGAPGSAVGADGDVYIDGETGDLYSKVDGDWTLTGNLQGPPGADGADVASVLTGSGAPESGAGTDGDIYLDVDSGDLYSNASGTWSVVGNLTGPAGETGAAGTDGAAWLTGSGAPANATGADGDLYFDEDTGDVYSKAAGTWSLVTGLVTHTFLDVNWYEFANGAATAQILSNTSSGITAALDGAANGNAGIGFTLARFGNVSLDPDAYVDFTATVPSGQVFQIELVSPWGLSGCTLALTGTGAAQAYTADFTDLTSGTGDSTCWGTFSLDNVNGLNFTTPVANEDFTIGITSLAILR
jgi:hypothetical protein